MMCRIFCLQTDARITIREQKTNIANNLRVTHDEATKVFDVSLSSSPAVFSHRKRQEMENVFAKTREIRETRHHG